MSSSKASVPRTPVPSPRKRSTLTPVVVSPADDDDVSPSAQDEESVFDLPSGPSIKRERTPLTPPETGVFSSNKLRDAEESPLLRKTAKRSGYFGAPTVAAEPVVDVNVKIKLEEDVDFEPRKIFRQQTVVMEQLREADAKKAPGITFSAVPVLDFSKVSGPTIRPVPKPKDPSFSTDPFQSTNPTAAKIPSKPTPSRRALALTKVLEHVIPFSIQQRLSENPEKCCGSIVSNAAKRCSKNAKGSPRTTLAALSSLAKAANKGKYAEVLSVTESVIKSAMCAHHIKSSTSTDRFGRLESAVEYLTNETGSSSSINIDEIHSWIEAISAITIQATESPIHVKAEATVKTEVASHVHDRTTGTTSKPQHKATFLPPLATLYPFQPFQSKRLQKMTVTDALKKLASRPLGEADLKPGFIYIFWYKPRFGHVKIGRSGNPERRIQEWNKQCKREHEFHKLSNALVEVPHVNRIENLMHVEMKELRRQMRCEGCGTNHREWFQVTEDHAVNVFEKWKDWILESPYKRDKNTGDWTLGSSSAKTLDEICEPVKLEKPERKQAPRKPRQKAQRKSVGSRPQLKRQLHLDDFLEVKPGEPLVKPQNEAPKAVPLSTKD